MSVEVCMLVYQIMLPDIENTVVKAGMTGREPSCICVEIMNKVKRKVWIS